MEDKTIIALATITAVTALQIYAWATGHNGTVFALTSATIAGIGAFFFGFKYKSNN